MWYKIIALFIIVAATTFFFFFRTKTKTGIIIVLNGPSGSGKSSIQKEFQKLMMPNLWIKVGIDNLFDFPMPDITPENMNIWQSKNPIRWVKTSKDKDNKNVITLFTGEQGEKVAYGMNSAIAAYAQNGCNLIVDYITYKPEWLTDLQNKLKNIKTYYIAVEISLDILEKREQVRATSPAGHARSHYATVYGNVNYDLKVNSGTDSAQEIVRQIQKLIKN